MKKLKWNLKKVIFHITNAYFWLLKKVIPCKIITIEFVDPLDETRKLYGTILAKMGYPYIPLDDILTSVFRATRHYLKREKDIDMFTGMEIKTPEGKFEIFYKGTGYTDKTNPARNNKDFKNE